MILTIIIIKTRAMQYALWRFAIEIKPQETFAEKTFQFAIVSLTFVNGLR